MGDEEDYGFVARDSKILQKALTNESSPRPTVASTTGSEGGEDVPQEVTTSAPPDRVSSTSSTERKVSVPKQNRKSSAGTESSHAAVPSVKRAPKVKMSKERDDATVPLPQSFQVKYLGQRDASGLWGIKHTRKPVDQLVTTARSMPAGQILPIVRLIVSKEGVSVLPLGKSQEPLRFHPIDTISYGVQDLVYTRVFCIIVVREGGNTHDKHPFECHAFVCDSRDAARRLTYALSAAFKEFSKTVKAAAAEGGTQSIKKKFAIDLRSPEEIADDLRAPDDSEA
ncbi:uncharacterized protein [Anabrus simplex]|uniref:uncharacterized protein n=1 Tax=Anabrus simplex TaxID=316456 RepID=UPI0035A3C24E